MQGFIRFLVFLALSIVISATIVIFSRLDQLTVSMLAGVLVGVLLAAPIASVVTCIAFRQRQVEAIASPYSKISQQPASQNLPPQIVMLPAPINYQQPMQITRQPTYHQAEPFILPTQRRFYMIGDDGSASELHPDDTQST